MSEASAAPGGGEPATPEEQFHTGASIKVATVAALGGFLFGYDSAVINGAVSAIGQVFNVESTTLGFAVASALLGAAAGAMSAGRIADRFGRLRVMQIAAVLFLISAIGAGFSTNVGMLIVFRIIGGLGVGIASVIAPAYIAEIAPASLRGRLGSLQQLAIVTGIFVSLLVDYIFATAAGGSTEVVWGLPAWRWMFLAMAIPAIVYGVLSLTIPESPRYLIANLRIPEARKVLTTMLGTAGTEVRIQRIEQSLKSDRKPSFKDLRAPKGGLLPIVWVGILLSVFQQFVGINVIFYYSNVLWEAVGFSEADSFKITVITAIVNIVTTLIAIASIDRFGRKPLLVIGSIGMTVTLGIMAFVFGIARTTTDASGAVTPVLEGWQGPAALIAANVYVVAFGMSWGPVVWVLLGESFPNKIRAAALSVAAMAQWVANWLITVSFPKMKDISLAFSYGFYAACALLSLFFVLKWVKETKGKELEDMDEMMIAPH
jgi:SP family sugar:H+ symporter-like MFS transporter